MAQSFDAVVIGGGFYGCAIAAYLKRRRGLQKVALLESEHGLLQRASFNNQARVHNGYHYPRSFTTAHRSRVNLPSFVRDHPLAVKRDFTKVYAIARRNSKVTARQFQRFCSQIGARLEPAPPAVRALFEHRLIEDVFIAEEFAFDARALAQQASSELDACGVEVRLNTRVTSLASDGDGIGIDCEAPAARITTRFAFNCTYSALNRLATNRAGSRFALKHEVAEIALVIAPPELEKLGITVMDGAFFSIMPFPARQLHSLSHVRYTPHEQWLDDGRENPYERLAREARSTRVDRMMRDARRYVPAIEQARHVESLFEVKTVLAKNEADDGRPILYERDAGLPGCFSILGGKIDNIYDVFERLDSETFDAFASPETH